MGPTPGERVFTAGAALGTRVLLVFAHPLAAPLGAVAATYTVGRALGDDASLAESRWTASRESARGSS